MITIDKIIKGGKNFAIGVAALATIGLAGCNGGGGSSGGGSTPTNTKPTIVSYSCISPVNEGGQGSCEVVANNASKYSFNYEWETNTGSFTENTTNDFNAPQVNADTNYNATVKACDEDNECVEASTEIVVKNVPEGSAPVILGFIFPEGGGLLMQIVFIRHGEKILKEKLLHQMLLFMAWMYQEIIYF
jgi:hypothetical protein